MAENLTNLIEEWKRRADELETEYPGVSWAHKQETVIQECIQDLKTTMHLMEANAVFQNLSRNSKRERHGSLRTN